METKLEYILTHSYKAEMISYLKSHPEDFDEAMKLAISDKQPYSWRAAWLLWSSMDNNDKRVHSYLKKIIAAIPAKKDNQQRELLMIVLRMQLNATIEGQLFDLCINLWKKSDKNPSLRYNAFKLLVSISKNHPHLTKEIQLLTQPHYISMLSDSVKKSIFRLAKELNYKES